MAVLPRSPLSHARYTKAAIALPPERHSETGHSWTQATFLLAGWTKEEPRTHVVRLVDACKVLAAKETLQPVTSYHAYSVQPSKPQVTRVPPPIQTAW